MKVTIRDSQILKTIEPSKLAEHLQTTGWHQDRPLNENSVIWSKTTRVSLLKFSYHSTPT